MNIGDIDLNLLRVFDAILREGSVTVAGTRLGLSQPAMSNALGRLRRIFNDPLFVRTPRGMHPTTAAQQLAEPLRQALDLIRVTLARHAGFDPARSDRLFRIHMSDIGEMVFLPPLLERLKSAAPRVQLETVTLSEKEVGEALVAGAIDLAVGFLPGLKGGIKQKILFRDRYVCIMRADHPAIGASLSLSQFLAASHVLVSSGAGHPIVANMFAERGLNDRVAVRVPHFTVVPMILERTDLVAAVPANVAAIFAKSGRFKVLRLPVDVPGFEVRIHWHERFDQDPASRWLRDLMVKIRAR